MLQKIKQLLDSSDTCASIENKNTFLSVIGRSYDEDLISRVIAYCLSQDHSLITRLINYYADRHLKDWDYVDLSTIRNVSVFPEKNMGFGRADIFVELTDTDGQAITITIENKIYSYEHKTGNYFQTQVYYEWVTRNHRDAWNVFYYLRPDYNASRAHCSAFENLTYGDLLSMLDESDNVIIQDFKAHIEYALRGDNMIFDRTERLLLNNYSIFEERRAEATKKVKAYQDLILQKVSDELGMTIVDWRKQQAGDTPDLLCEKDNYGAGIGSYRLYKEKDNEKWYEENKHYFYVEIKFENGCLDRVYFQCTIRDDEKGKNEHKVPKFFHDTPDIKLVTKDGRYYVIEQHSFFDEEWGTDEWEQRFIETAVQYLRSYIARMDYVFAEYRNFKTQL